MCGGLRIKRKVYQPGDYLANPTPGDHAPPGVVDSVGPGLASAFTNWPLCWGFPRDFGANNNMLVGVMPPFAKSENLDKVWLSAGWQTQYIIVDDFAEIDRNRQFRWNNDSAIIKVVTKRYEVENILRYTHLAVVTRASTRQELARFDHHRMPVTINPALREKVPGFVLPVNIDSIGLIRSNTGGNSSLNEDTIAI